MYENLFLTDKHHRLIMRTLYDFFVKHHNYEVGVGEEELTFHVMKDVIAKNPATRNDKPRDYIKMLLRRCVGIVKGIVENDLIKKENEYEQRIRANEELKSRNTLGTNNDVTQKFDQLNKMRNPEPEKNRPIPNFADPIDNNNIEVSKKFEELNKLREIEQQKTEKTLKVDNNKVPIVPKDSINQPKPITQLRDNLGPVEPQPVNEESLNDINNVGNLNNAPQSMGQQLLIQKPKEFENLVNNAYKYNNNFIKRFNLVIDSRDRNTDNYPNEYKYQIDLDRIYKDIVSIELVSANVPKTEYLINSSNNTIYFTENGGSELTAVIPTGNYTPTTLATAIKDAMEAVGADTYTVTADETLTNKFTITKSSGTLGLNFNGGTETYGLSTRTVYRNSSIGSVIGFSPIDLSGVATYTGQNQYNLNGPTYILLNIDNLDNLWGVHNNAVTKSFAKISLDTNQSNYKYFKSQNDYIVRKEFSPPLAKLAQLNIEFLNYDGSFYDFNGLPHTLYFKITTLNQNQGYFI